jgi:hypothetical protein
MNKFKQYHLLLIPVLLFFLTSQQANAQAQGSIKFHFSHYAGNKVIEADSVYTNPFGETFTVRKLKYYISNISFDSIPQPESYFLVNALEENTFTIPVEPGRLKHITFMIGVDSAHNCSGAQSGALDPINDMFWTWNSGYVMLKLEGYSPQSNADLNRIEHHIGGFKGPYKTMRQVSFSLPRPLILNAGQQQDLVIAVNLDKYFKGIHDIRIKDDALLVTAGEKASRFADNFPAMFYLKGYTE